MINRYFRTALFCASILLSLSSCYSIKYAPESQVLNQEEIAEDITFLKRKLSKRHYNLNWEGREQTLLASLDSIAVTHANITTLDFLQKIKPVLKTVDDGHTFGFIFQEKDKDRLKRTPKHFSCHLLDKETVLLKIPDFRNRSGLVECLTSFDSLSRKPGITTLIVDLRNNHGGNMPLVDHFLQRMITHKTRLCSSFQVKNTFAALNPLNTILNKIRGYNNSNKYFIKKGRLLRIRHSMNIAHKYVLVDSTIISASMLAVYHLKNAGFTVIGSNPSSLFNTFGNPIQVNLPNSHLYVFISTARILVDENHADRSADMLSCDIQIKEESLEQILELIRQYEAHRE